MARPSNTDERRRQIADGLRLAMARGGYDGASIARIAAAASLPPGIVHYHFRNKREVLLELLAVIGAEHDARLDEAIAAAGDDPAAQLRALLDANLALGERADPRTVQCWVMACAEAIKDPVVRAAWDRALDGSARRLVAILDRGVERRAFRCPLGVTDTAAALLSLVQGYLLVAATARKRIPRGSAARCARAMAEGLLSPSRAAVRKGRPRRSTRR